MSIVHFVIKAPKLVQMIGLKSTHCQSKMAAKKSKMTASKISFFDIFASWFIQVLCSYLSACRFEMFSNDKNRPSIEIVYSLCNKCIITVLKNAVHFARHPCFLNHGPQWAPWMFEAPGQRSFWLKGRYSAGCKKSLPTPDLAIMLTDDKELL